MSGEASGPMRTGPPAPISISATRRRISAHDAVAQLGLRDHHGPQVLCRDEQRLHVVDSVRVDQCRPPGELPQLGREVTGDLLNDGGEMPQRIAPRHTYATGSEHEGPGSDFPRYEERLTLGKALHLAEADQPVDLPGREFREHFLITRIDARHGFFSALVDPQNPGACHRFF